MSEPSQMDKTFQIIMKRMIETGQAPHYTDIASELDVPLEEARKALHKLFFQGFPGWLYPTQTSLFLFHHSTTCPPNTVLLSMANKSGSANEVLNRWRSAGFFRAKQSTLMHLAWIVVQK